MKSIYKQLALWSVMVLMLSLTSCRTQKSGTKTITSNIEQTLYEQVLRNTFRYDALQSKVKYSLNGNSLNGKMCLESGRRLCLQVNAPLLGFEVARVEASQQSVLIVDKYDKQYAELNLSDLYQIDDISGHEMEALECLMLGRIYIPGVGPARSRDFGLFTWKTSKYVNSTRVDAAATFTGRNYRLTYTMNETGRLVSAELVVPGKYAKWSYDAYAQVEKGIVVPTQETITAVNEEDKTVSLTLSLSKPEVGESSWRDFEPTSSYRRVTIDALVETVKKMIN